jgi:predicted RNA-binding protein
MSAEQRYEYLKSMETKAIAKSESRQPIYRYDNTKNNLNNYIKSEMKLILLDRILKNNQTKERKILQITSLRKSFNKRILQV